jgi:hypothetical protein
VSDAHLFAADCGPVRRSFGFFKKIPGTSLRKIESASNAKGIGNPPIQRIEYATAAM